MRESFAESGVLSPRVSAGLASVPRLTAPRSGKKSGWPKPCLSPNLSPSFNPIMFTGTYTAIVTPFKEGKVDEPALERLLKAQIKAGVDGIVPVGTTGESPTLSFEEHIYVIEQVVRWVGGKINVLAGTGA